jgi:hypothetical protein
MNTKHKTQNTKAVVSSRATTAVVRNFATTNQVQSNGFTISILVAQPTKNDN